MKKTITSISLCLGILSFSPQSFAGGNTVRVIIPGNHAPQRFKMPKSVNEGDYLPNIVIVKVKPEYRANCRTSSINNLLPLQDFMNEIGTENLEKIFPNHTSPGRTVNALGENLVDLSQIYSFHYNKRSYSLETVINKLLSLGYFEYAQPWYVPKLNMLAAPYMPNDPNLNKQYHLQGNVVGSVNTLDAWGVTKGSASVVIGIVDTGTEPDHPDLKDNIFHNVNDPINGIDDDKDGYIDNYTGWDLGVNDNDPTWQGSNHGCATSGDACATTDNSAGVSSPGFNCKFLPVKGADASGALVAVYPGIVYAADHGAKIISNSWGGTGGGPYGQDVVSYAAINKNCLVLASAGNDNQADILKYPSSYQHCYRVASSDNADQASDFTTVGWDVDYSAPGTSIYSTVDGTKYGYMSGTSMACPVSAGVAGLIQTKFNYTNAFQIGEKMKQTCDSMANTSTNNTSILFKNGKLGKGRIDAYKALTQNALSIIANPVTITDGNDNIFMPGETLTIFSRFTNYLDACSGSAQAELSVVSGASAVNITSGSYTIGALATLDTTNNRSNPFKVTVSNNANINQTVKFKIHITDGSFTGDQYFEITVNVDYINIKTNDVFTTATSKGWIGYNSFDQSIGLGFEYQLPTPHSMIYEMGLMVGSSSTQVSDRIRNGSKQDSDFVLVSRAALQTSNTVSDFDVDGKFNDNGADTNKLPIEVHHNIYAWSTAPYRKFVIAKYKIKNTGSSTLNNVYAGLFSDWDIPNEDAGKNKAAFDSTYRMGYAWHVGSPELYGGIAVLSKTAPVNHYAIDNTSGGNGGVDVTSAFTKAQKYTVLSTMRNKDGYAATGGDVLDCVSSGPFTINAGDSVEVAFAVIAGDNLADLQNSACAAQSKYSNGCAVGVKDLEKDNFWMYSYPNPASSLMNISYNIANIASSGTLRIMNSLGEIVMTINNVTIGKNILSVDVSRLAAGHYLYQLKAGESVLTKQFSIVK